MQSTDAIIEVHPWEPFIPNGARVLFLGTFPPGSHRWAMDFFYPNPTNDFWRVMGIIYLSDIDAYYIRKERKYREDDIRKMLVEHHIAMGDTGRRVRRLKGNASDKFLEIVEPIDLESVLAKMPNCQAIATTGEKAATVLAEITGTSVPAMGQCVQWNGIKIWRLPSTSRAYPLKPEAKAEFYRSFLESAGCI